MQPDQASKGCSDIAHYRCGRPSSSPENAGDEQNLRRGSLDQFLTQQEVCELLGISSRTLRRWRRDGRLPSVRISGTVRVRVSDLEHALSTRARDEDASPKYPSSSTA